MNIDFSYCELWYYDAWIGPVDFFWDIFFRQNGIIHYFPNFKVFFIVARIVILCFSDFCYSVRMLLLNLNLRVFLIALFKVVLHVVLACGLYDEVIF